MKSLIKYLTEEYNTYRIKNLEVKYNVQQDKGSNVIVFNVPEVYSEDDLQIYLQDKYFKELPASEDKAEDFFGKNQINIYDVLFEYDKYEKSDNGEDSIEWDKEIDNKHDIEKEDFTFVTLTNLRYVIKFDKFDLKNENTGDIKQVIFDIFKRAESNETNDYPVLLTLNEKNIKYTE